MEPRYNIAGIDVHKKMLAVAVANARETELEFECRRFGTTVSEIRALSAWLKERGVQEAAMESTAQYWKPVWLGLEGQCRLHLAQARSNRGPRGRKTDFRDAKRVVSRLLSGDLILSFVPEAEQRCWRTLTRTKYQLTRDRVRLQSQLESLLEECQIKLSSVVSDLRGASGRRILRAIANGETNPVRLAELGDKRLRATEAELTDALSGQVGTLHRQVLSRSRSSRKSDRRRQPSPQPPNSRRGSGSVRGGKRAPENPVATAPPRAIVRLRRLLDQLAHAAVRKDGTQMQIVFRRLSARMGYNKAIWAIAHRLCRLIWKVLHDNIRYVEHGFAPTPIALKRRRQRLVTQLRRMGYEVELTPLPPGASV